MGLDVYVGSVTRYTLGDWENVIQQAYREAGETCVLIRVNASKDAITDPAVILDAVLEWRESLSRRLKNGGLPALDWDERPDAPYFTDKPAWEAYGDLMLWAAYADDPSAARPIMSVEDWTVDPVFARVSKGETRFRTLIGDVEAWYPTDFRATFQAEWVNDQKMEFGSAPQLLRQLRILNEETWQASPDTISEWRRAGKEKSEPLETGAKFAFAVFLELAVKAVEHRLVMKLDY